PKLGKCTYQSVVSTQGEETSYSKLEYLPKCCVNPGGRDIFQQTRISKYKSVSFGEDLQLMVIRFIPYIEDSVLGLISQDSGLFLKNGGRPFVRQRLSDPSSLTELHLSISDLFLEEQSVKYTISKGCHRLF